MHPSPGEYFRQSIPGELLSDSASRELFTRPSCITEVQTGTARSYFILRLPYPKEYNEIVFIIETQGSDEGHLKPIYEALDGVYDYGQLRCVQASI